jgi:hypothetical protein
MTPEGIRPQRFGPKVLFIVARTTFLQGYANAQVNENVI